ncbi:MAG: hypothetical protein LBN09_08960 [Clostridioides sp.]|jgi:hypothetical protein|nr:hypothetical protein [Clostridioides sp.]
MSSDIDFAENEAMKAKRVKKMKFKKKDKCSKSVEEDDIDIEAVMKTPVNKKASKGSKQKNSSFRNNYKNYQYDYEEDFYEPR